MNNFESTEPKERIISSLKGNGCVSFYNHYFSFKLEKDHTPRKIKYRDIDKIIHKNGTWLYVIYLVIALVCVGVIISNFLYETLSIYTLINFSLLLIFLIINFFEKGKLIQIKKGSLKVDVFRSNKSNEIQEVITLLRNYTEKE
ncbi:MAG: hypothetical protein ACO3QK_04780 [Flavobacteriaceae bacterium]